LVRLLSFRKATGRRPPRVVIVEDSENYAPLLLRELRRGGYEPEHQRVRTPEAMKQVLSRSDWDVIDSDYPMPHFGTPETLAVSQGFENHVGEDGDLGATRRALRVGGARRRSTTLCTKPFRIGLPTRQIE
jgi:CheY-like chemotaxis protein